MRGDAVPDFDHISRFCGGARVKPDGTISGEAFRLRNTNVQSEEYLSVNWLEFLDKENRVDEIREIKMILATKFKVGSNAKIAVLNAGEMCSHVHKNSEDRRILRVLHEPETNDPSHSGIYDLKLDDVLIADLIAQTIRETHPAKAS